MKDTLHAQIDYPSFSLYRLPRLQWRDGNNFSKYFGFVV